MIQIALVADLHGNRPATEALERDLNRQKPDKICCLGDIVGKGPDSPFTFDWAVEHCDLIVGGNWDYGVGFRRFPLDDFYWQQLGEKRMERLCALPKEAELELGGRRIRLFHGRPIMEELVTAHMPAERIEPYFLDDQGGRYDVVAYADAHRQAVRTMTPGIFLNCGSVGNALGIPKCCYALLCGGDGEWEIRLRQLDYDRERAVQDALRTPKIPRIESYIREIQTGLYSRAGQGFALHP